MQQIDQHTAQKAHRTYLHAYGRARSDGTWSGTDASNNDGDDMRHALIAAAAMGANDAKSGSAPKAARAFLAELRDMIAF